MLSEGVTSHRSSTTWSTKGTSKSYHGLVAFLCWSAYALGLLGSLVVPVDALLLGHVHEFGCRVLRLHNLVHDDVRAAAFHTFAPMKHFLIGRSDLIQTDQRGAPGYLFGLLLLHLLLELRF